MSFGGAPSSPKPPPFKKVNLGEASTLFSKYQSQAYDSADADTLARLPGLVALRDYNIGKSASDVTGPLDPAAQNAFVTGATGTALGAFGGGVSGGAGEAGSAARRAAAAGVANQTQGFQDNALQNLQGEIQSNPQRLYDLTGDQALQIMIGNVVGQNQHAYQVYQSAVQGSNASSAAGAQQTQAGIQAGISIIGLIVGL